MMMDGKGAEWKRSAKSGDLLEKLFGDWVTSVAVIVRSEELDRYIYRRADSQITGII